MRSVVGLALPPSRTMVLNSEVATQAFSKSSSQRPKKILVLVHVWGDSTPFLVCHWEVRRIAHLEVARSSRRSSPRCCRHSWLYPRVPCLGMSRWAGLTDSLHKVISGRAGKEAKLCCTLAERGSALPLGNCAACRGVAVLLFPCTGICLHLEPTSTPSPTLSRAAVLSSCDNWTVVPSKNWGKSWSIYYCDGVCTFVWRPLM